MKLTELVRSPAERRIVGALSEPVRVSLLLTTPGWRGSGVSFAKIALGLTRRGHAVEMLVSDAGAIDQLAALGVVATRLSVSGTGVGTVHAVRTILRKHRASVVIVDTPRDVRLARWASLGSGTRVVWRYNLSGRDVPDDPLHRWLLGGLAAIVVTSEYAAQRLRTQAPWLSHVDTTLIPNGVVIASTADTAERARRFRTRHGIPTDTMIVLTIGSAAPEKSLAVAAGAVEAASCVSRICWVVTVSADALPTGSNELLTVLPVGWLASDALADALAAADIVLHPGYRELSSNAVLEAMAAGRVVVAAEGGANAEMLEATGKLFAAGDSGEAARLICALAAAPQQRDSLGEAARGRAAARYSVADMERGYADVVSKMVAGRTPRRGTA